jgi:ribosomal peptide maturation radical SAM protein 1
VKPAVKPVALISMPTLAARFPSFQLALLKPTLERAGFAVEPMSLFLRFGEQIGWRLNETLANVYPCMAGEWIWGKAAFGDVGEDSDVGAYFRRYGSNFDAICAEAGCAREDIVQVREHEAEVFIDKTVRQIDWSAYGLVGFTVVFQQMVASLALAKALKREYPELPIIFGGATFEDDIALEILSRNPEVDFIHCGDADLSLPEVVSRVYAKEPMTGMRGVMWQENGRVSYAGRAPNVADLDRTPVPDFDEYFSMRSRTGYDGYPGAREAMLPIETARGCWYGMKNHCTFCGLNRAGMEFRSKSPDRVLEMLKILSRRYGARHFNAIDNILAPAYMSRLFGRLADAHCDLRLHYEIRPKITRAQLGRLHRGGLASVQPGIESFSTNVLTLMRKNTTGISNLELLKWTTYYGMDNSYNILFGFPGETAEDYRLQADVIRRIPHLQPPYAMAQARPDRGSPMFERPAEHAVSALRPAACYRHIYPAGYDLNRVSYFFEHELEGELPQAGYRECHDLVADWKSRWASAPRPYLRYLKTWDSVSIHDGRHGTRRSHRFDDAEARLYELCADAKAKDELLAELGCEAAWLDAALARFIDLDLMVGLDGRYLSLALPENPYF